MTSRRNEWLVHLIIALSAMACVLLASGCATQAAYEPPTPDAPAQAVATDMWWNGFADTSLNELMHAAEQANTDLRIYAARLAQAHAEADIDEANTRPEINASTSATRQRQVAAGSAAGISSNGSATITTSWELDFFGARKSARDASAAQWQASAADRVAMLISVRSEVATAYLQLRTLDARLRVVADQLHSREATLRITQRRLEAGTVTEADVQAQMAQRATLLAQAAELSRLRERQQHLLVALCGVPAAMVSAIVSKEAAAPGSVPTFERSALIELPADAIRKRPDVIAAERRVAGAHAGIGIAIADLYPKFTLGGSIGWGRFAAGGVSSSGETWSLGPSITIPLLDWGRRQANVSKRRAIFDEALAGYEKTVITAVREVEDAMTDLRRTQQRLEQLGSAAQSYRAAAAASHTRFRNGVASRLELEESMRSFLGAADDFELARGALSQAWVALFKASGGSWPG